MSICYTYTKVKCAVYTHEEMASAIPSHSRMIATAKELFFGIAIFIGFFNLNFKCYHLSWFPVHKPLIPSPLLHYKMALVTQPTFVLYNFASLQSAWGYKSPTLSCTNDYIILHVYSR